MKQVIACTFLLCSSFLSAAETSITPHSDTDESTTSQTKSPVPQPPFSTEQQLTNLAELKNTDFSYITKQKGLRNRKPSPTRKRSESPTEFFYDQSMLHNQKTCRDTCCLTMLLLAVTGVSLNMMAQDSTKPTLTAPRTSPMDTKPQ